MNTEYKQIAISMALLSLLTLTVTAGASSLHVASHDARALKADPKQAKEPIAPVLSGVGNTHLAVSTESEKAQFFFDQGLRLTYAFNHQEALRSFKEAVRHDPDCAMAYWGWALALGPNLNLPMSAEVVPQAYEAIQMALAHKDKASAKEKAYIEALAERYAPPDVRSRAAGYRLCRSHE